MMERVDAKKKSPDIRSPGVDISVLIKLHFTNLGELGRLGGYQLLPSTSVTRVQRSYIGCE